MDDVTRIDHPHAGAPADRRGNRGIAKLNRGVVDLRLIVFDRRGVLLDQRELRVALLQRTEALRGQRLVALQMSLALATSASLGALVATTSSSCA